MTMVSRVNVKYTLNCLYGLSPCLFFVSFVCPDLYVLGDGALMGWGSIMRAKRLCVLVRIWAGGGVGAPLGRFGPSSGIFLLAVPGRCFLCKSFVLFLSCFVVLSCAFVCWCLVVACWGWPLDSRLWWLVVTLSFFRWFKQYFIQIISM